MQPTLKHTHTHLQTYIHTQREAVRAANSGMKCEVIPSFISIWDYLVIKSFIWHLNIKACMYIHIYIHVHTCKQC